MDGLSRQTVAPFIEVNLQPACCTRKKSPCYEKCKKVKFKPEKYKRENGEKNDREPAPFTSVYRTGSTADWT